MVIFSVNELSFQKWEMMCMAWECIQVCGGLGRTLQIKSKFQYFVSPVCGNVYL